MYNCSILLFVYLITYCVGLQGWLSHSKQWCPSHITLCFQMSLILSNNFRVAALLYDFVKVKIFLSKCSEFSLGRIWKHYAEISVLWCISPNSSVEGGDIYISFEKWLSVFWLLSAFIVCCVLARFHAWSGSGKQCRGLNGFCRE